MAAKKKTLTERVAELEARVAVLEQPAVAWQPWPWYFDVTTSPPNGTLTPNS